MSCVHSSCALAQWCCAEGLCCEHVRSLPVLQGWVWLWVVAAPLINTMDALVKALTLVKKTISLTNLHKLQELANHRDRDEIVQTSARLVLTTLIQDSVGVNLSNKLHFLHYNNNSISCTSIQLS